MAGGDLRITHRMQERVHLLFLQSPSICPCRFQSTFLLSRSCEPVPPRYSSSKYWISKRCLSSTITIMRTSIFLKTGRVRTTWNPQYCSLDTLNRRAQSLHDGICRMVFRYVHEKCHMRNGASSYAPVQSKSHVRLRSGQEQRKTINLRCRFQASVSSVYDIAAHCRCV